jgi:hypothetical protein
LYQVAILAAIDPIPKPAVRNAIRSNIIFLF